MALIAKSAGQSSFTPVPQGEWLARCYRIVDLGKQPSEWEGKISYKPKIMLLFEVHGKDKNGNPLVTPKGEPMSISKNFNNSMHEASAFRREVGFWFGKRMTDAQAATFDPRKLLGKWAMIQVVHTVGKDGNTYANIDSIGMVDEELRNNLPQGHNKAEFFDLDEPNMELFETFSDKLKAKIMSSPEWKERVEKPKKSGGDSGFDDMDSDVPF